MRICHAQLFPHKFTAAGSKHHAAQRTDRQLVTAAFSEEVIHVSAVCLRLFRRNKRLYCSGKAAAVYPDSTLVPQKLLAVPDSQRDRLLFRFLAGIQVLQQLPGRSPGRFHQGKESGEVTVFQCLCLCRGTLVFRKEMGCPENRPVRTAFPFSSVRTDGFQ